MNTIISLSGSNPLSERTMQHLRKDGLVVYIDNDKHEIMKRCHKMKIDRVVGMSTKTFSEILDYRREIYEKYYDYRVLVENNQSVEEIANDVSNILNKNENYIDIFSDCENDKIFFENIVEEENTNKHFFPEKVNKLSLGKLERLINMNSVERFTRILELLPHGNVRPQNLNHHFNFKKLESLTPFSNLGHNMKINLSNCANLIKNETPFTMVLSKLPNYVNLYLDLVKSQTIKIGTKVDLSVNDDFFYKNNFSDISAFALSKLIGIPFGALTLNDSLIETSRISSIAKEMKKSNNFLSLLYLMAGDMTLYNILKKESLSEEYLSMILMQILEDNSKESDCRIFIN